MVMRATGTHTQTPTRARERKRLTNGTKERRKKERIIIKTEGGGGGRDKQAREWKREIGSLSFSFSQVSNRFRTTLEL
jgi:hypothetical protein